jgi:hypothetical protein
VCTSALIFVLIKSKQHAFSWLQQKLTSLSLFFYSAVCFGWMMVPIRVQSSCLHSLPWCNPFISSLTMTYLVWMASNIITEILIDVGRSIFFSFSRYIQLLFCQYHVHTHTRGHKRRVESYERLTVIFDVFFFLLFFVVRPLFVYTHIDMSSSIRQLDT